MPWLHRNNGWPHACKMQQLQLCPICNQQLLQHNYRPRGPSSLRAWGQDTAWALPGPSSLLLCPGEGKGRWSQHWQTAGRRLQTGTEFQLPLFKVKRGAQPQPRAELSPRLGLDSSAGEELPGRGGASCLQGRGLPGRHSDGQRVQGQSHRRGTCLKSSTGLLWPGRETLSSWLQRSCSRARRHVPASPAAGGQCGSPARPGRHSARTPGPPRSQRVRQRCPPHAGCS